MNADQIAAVDQMLASLRAQYGGQAVERLEKFVHINTGRQPLRPHPLQKPLRFFFPDLGDTGWYDPMAYAETRTLKQKLEAAYPIFRKEYLDAVRPDDLIPYSQESGGRFASLRTQDWGTFYLRRMGEPVVERNCAACPGSARVLKEIELHLSPDGGAFFSVLGPRAVVPPHHDSTNLKLTVHLALIVPPGCGIRVNGETRGWEEGKILMFDDTFEHEVWNQSDLPRVCFLMDIWHPLLTPLERQVITQFYQFLRGNLGADYRPPWLRDATGAAASGLAAASRG